MAMYKKKTRRKVVKGKKMKRSMATRRKHKKSKGRRTRRGGVKGPRPGPIKLPTAVDRARNAMAAPSTAVALDRRGQDVFLDGPLPSPSADDRRQRVQNVAARVEEGFGQAAAAAAARAQERNQLPPSP